MFRMRSLLLTLALAAGVAACGGKTSDESTPPTPGVTQTVGAAGGTVTYPNGPIVEIPAGALASNQAINIRWVGTSPAGTQSFAFTPAGLTFDPSKVVTVSFPVAGGTTTAAVYWSQPATTDQFEALAATVRSGRASARILHFSSGHVGLPCTEQEACAPANECDAGSRSCASGAPACSDTGEARPADSACSIGVCSGLQFDPETQVTSAPVCIAACHAIGLGSALPVNVEYLSASAPDPTGGTIASGTYYLSAVYSYGADLGAATQQEAWIVNGATIQGALDGAGGTERWTATGWSTSGSVLSLDITCPNSGTAVYGYTVSGNTLKLYYVWDTNTFEQVFLKQ